MSHGAAKQTDVLRGGALGAVLKYIDKRTAVHSEDSFGKEDWGGVAIAPLLNRRVGGCMAHGRVERKHD